MIKLLLVGDSPRLAKALTMILSVLGIGDIRVTKCQEAVNTLQDYCPTHVLFFDYNEERGVSGICWFELQLYRARGMKMARMGLPRYPYPDYIHLLGQGLFGVLRFLGITAEPK